MSNLDLCYLFMPISRKQCMQTNVFIKHIYKVIYDFSVDLVTFDYI